MRSNRILGPEATIHLQVCQYMKLQHPAAIFRTDFAAGIKMTVGQARKHKSLQSSRAYPDLFIAEPRGGYAGLYLELKRENTRVWLKDGKLSTEAHIQEQAEMLRQLNKRGYCAVFAVGFDDARSKIDRYLAGPKNLPSGPALQHQPAALPAQ